MKMMSSPPILERDLRVITNVLKINCKLFPRLMSRRSLNTLKLLRIVIVPLILSEVFADIKILAKEPTTITVSNIFHPSLKYSLGSIAVILIIASKMNIPVNM